MTQTQAHRLIDNFHLLSYDEVDSTNDEARRLAEGGASHGAFIWAKRQSAGRGRMGRHWVSQEGNLFVSVLLKPDVAPESLPDLSFVTALAALDALQPVVGDTYPLRLKWPNDILLNDRKVAGVLLESFSDDRGHVWVVAGLGVNIEHHPSDVMFPATHLMEADVQIVSAKIVLSRFIHHFIQRYDGWIEEGFVPIREQWRRHAWRLGEEVSVCSGNDTVRGRFEDIDDQGRLRLVMPGGVRRIVTAGDMTAALVEEKS